MEREPNAGQDAARITREYRRLSGFYDLLAVPRLTNGVRREAVARLRLPAGGSVMDLGCGTGLNFPMLVQAIGPTGRVVGVDLSPDQLRRAGERAREAGWGNVSLVQANAEELELEEAFDGIISSYTHDIMTSPLAVERAVAHLARGGRFVSLGFCRSTGWRAPLNIVFTAFYRLFNVPINWDAETSSRPWTNLERQLGPAKVKRRFLGVWYRAVSVKPGDGAE
jgi:demethylmenaquinone methyltransferase/2-methoxy-6-polyprenyl-1,4-benzoquinol methylase